MSTNLNDAFVVFRFIGRTREQARAKAVAHARTIKPAPSEDYGFVCSGAVIHGRY